MPTGTLWPAATVTGRLGETSEKYCEEIETLLIVTDVEPRFVTVADKVLLVPAWTLPNASVEFNTDKMPDSCCEDGPALTPWQPKRTARLTKMSSATAAFQDCWRRILT